MDTRKDAPFIEDTRRIGVDVNPLGGAEICNILREIDKADPAVIESLTRILN